MAALLLLMKASQALLFLYGKQYWFGLAALGHLVR